jgi:TRAP-type C4-dicarboxylate transport system substrate-binding protein
MKNTRKIKWLIAHQPAYLFFRTARAFQQELNKIIPGRFDIEILTTDQYIAFYGDVPEMKMRPPAISGLEDISPNPLFERDSEFKGSRKKWDAIFAAIADGRIEMSQTQVTTIGNRLQKNFTALELPFLFEDHDHATRVLDGEIGEELLKDLESETAIRGLSFTYSGGYRVIGSQHEIKNLDDLKLSKLISTTDPTQQFFVNLGIDSINKFKLLPEDSKDHADFGGSIETTYLRFSGKSVLKTNHSMFLTTILTGETFWNSLTDEEQSAFKQAGKAVAKIERSWSIEETNKYEQRAESRGIKIFEISPEEKFQMKSIAEMNYKTVDRDFKSGLVNRILDLREKK